MRKVITILSFFFLFTSAVKADKCEQINCNQIKDYVNSKLIQGSILKIAEKDNKEKANYDKFKAKLEASTIENPLAYSDLSNMLDDNDFKKTRMNMGDKVNSVTFSIENIQVVDSISVEIFKTIAQKLTQAQKDGIKDYKKLKDKLISQINSYISTKLEPEEREPITEPADISFDDQKPNEITTNNNEEMSANNTSFSWLNSIIYPAFLPTILLIIIYLILSSEINKVRTNIKILRSDYEKIKMSSGTNTFQSQNNFQQNIAISKAEFEKNLGNSERFESLHNELEKLRIQLANLDKPKSISNQIQQGESNSIQSNSVNTSNDIFYMKYPVENSFSNNHKSITKENTIYKFLIKSNKTEADFEIHTDGVKIEEIISMVEKAIKSGCEENNNPTNNTKNIRTLKAGLVTLEGDKWVIKRKAMIKYE
jgi:hypothetical protein